MKNPADAFVEIVKLIAECVHDWWVYKLRGHARPDDLESKDYPIIAGPGDASAQKVIDTVKQPDSKK